MKRLLMFSVLCVLMLLPTAMGQSVEDRLKSLETDMAAVKQKLGLVNEVPAAKVTLRVYHIGNSVTDTIKPVLLKKLVQFRGNEYVFGRHVIPGTPLDGLWSQQGAGFSEPPYGTSVNALSNFVWDAVTLQPFDRMIVPTDGMPGELDSISKFVDLIVAKNPNTQVYVYARWARRDLVNPAAAKWDGTDPAKPIDYQAKWNRAYTGRWDGTNETADFFSKLTAQLNTKYAGKLTKLIKVVPVGEAVAEFDRMIRAGSVPGITTIDQIYTDHIHFNDIGAYLVGVTFEATLYNDNPVGLPFADYTGVTADIARAIQTAVNKVRTGVVTPAPTTNPTPTPAAVRVLTLQEAKDAVAGGSRLLQTPGLDVSSDFDAKGAVIELLPGGPSWKPAIALSGSATLSNATIKIPPSTYNAQGQRTGFNYAMDLAGNSMVVKNVTFAPDSGFCMHLLAGQVTLENVKATTFSEYFIFQEAGTYAKAVRCEVKGGSRAESVWRTSAGRFLIEDSVLDNSAGGKAVLRGDSPAWPDGSPGGVVRRTTLVGNVGINPLTEDDGGQMLGIDRWRFAEGWVYQLPYTRKAETIAFAQAERAAGKTPAQIVRACADRFIDPDQFANVAKGKRRLSDEDVALTLEFRSKEVSRSATFVISDCTITGDLRLNARTTGVVENVTLVAGPGLTPISTNSQTTYPYPVDRLLMAAEAKPGPAVEFKNVTISGGAALGLNLSAFPQVRFTNTKYNSKPVGSVQ